MQYSSVILLSVFAVTNVFGHGVIDSVKGANGVDMPGLSVADGTPRDCASPACGSEADTSIIRNRELGSNKATALGRTQGGGPVKAATMVKMFMGSGGGNSTASKEARDLHAANLLRRSLVARGKDGGSKTPKGTVETGVKAALGMGSEMGMPTCGDDGTVSMTFHQVNQDGAGPLAAMADGTSGGTDPAAFKKATVTKNVPGIGIGGLSAAAVMDFPVEAKLPDGMTCDASVGGVDNVCVMKLMNSAAAGPFGGSVAFTQSPAAKKRAIEYNLRKRNFARALIKRKTAAEIEAEEIDRETAEEDAEEDEKKNLTKRQQSEAAAAIAALEAMGSATKAEDNDLDAAEKKGSTAQGKTSEEKEAEKIDRETAAEDADEKVTRSLTKRQQSDAAAAIAALEAMGSATKAEDDDQDAEVKKGSTA